VVVGSGGRQWWWAVVLGSHGGNVGGQRSVDGASTGE